MRPGLTPQSDWRSRVGFTLTQVIDPLFAQALGGLAVAGIRQFLPEEVLQRSLAERSSLLDASLDELPKHREIGLVRYDDAVADFQLCPQRMSQGDLGAGAIADPLAREYQAVVSPDRQRREADALGELELDTGYAECFRGEV